MELELEFGEPVESDTAADGATLAVWTPTPKVLLTRVVGHFNHGFAQRIMAQLDGMVAAHGTLVGCHDWLGVEGYDIAAQRDMTAWSVRHLKLIEEIVIGVRSPLVRMAVTVANVPLKGMIQLFEDEPALDNAIVGAVRRSQGLT